MGASKKWIIAGFLYGGALFLLSPSFQKIIENPGFWNLKEQFLYLTGSIAMVYMVISMVLSLRINRINDLIGGLDKAYIVHKWVGIYAFTFTILHWIVKEGPSVLQDLNLVPPKIKSSGGISPYSDFQKSLFDFGNDMVEIAFYIFIAVIIISLLKKIPYHLFRWVHKTIPVLFLVIAYHGATIQIKGQWFGSIGSYLLCAVLIIGSIAAIICLLQLIGKNHKVKATISKLNYDKKSGLVDINLSIPEGHFSYTAGQYVFLQFASGEPHPFSIASFDKDMKSLRIIIKELGDFTKRLPNIISEGDSVIIEGPYGSFTFEGESQRQIWIAGGIGVTPFMSRLDYLAANGGQNKPVDFFYSARGESPLKPVLEELCRKAGVNFHYTDTSKTGRLCIDNIEEKAKGFLDASIWYCGSNTFCDSLKKALKENKSKIQFHYDNFDMR